MCQRICSEFATLLGIATGSRITAKKDSQGERADEAHAGDGRKSLLHDGGLEEVGDFSNGAIARILDDDAAGEPVDHADRLHPPLGVTLSIHLNEDGLSDRADESPFRDTLEHCLQECRVDRFPRLPQGRIAEEYPVLQIEVHPLLGLKAYPFEIVSDWHQAKAEIVSFEPEELFGTKLRALLQRIKNRDLFDLNEGPTVTINTVIVPSGYTAECKLPMKETTAASL